MAEQGNDPGTGTRFNTDTRLVNSDGSYNVKKRGGLGAMRDVYHFMVNVSWWKFNGIILLLFLGINVSFACAYLVFDESCISGKQFDDGTFTHFLRCFYFSVQTMTTIGYGNLYPACHSTQIIASAEALTGLMCLAVMTGVFYGRFSKPTAKLVFGKNALISPFNNGKAFMIRFANKRNDVLMHVQATLLYSSNKKTESGEIVRTYYRMPLQFDTIQAMPLSWTLVHVIDDKSPFWNKTVEDMRAEHMEVLVQIKAFDETYHADVHARYSYSANQLVENARFSKTFDTDADGSVLLDLNTIGKYESVN
ncbi:MAG: ion channel [Flavobacteriales bacterium]